jgi:triphosphatase
VETELKFQVPPQARAKVQRAIATRTARSVNLRAHYFDTPDWRLASAGLGLRLRLEGSDWVQTLKAQGANPLQRFEHEVRVEGTGGEPQLDLERHAGTRAAQMLEDALGDAAHTLQAAYRIDVQRTLRIARRGSSVVEVAFDVGELIAGARREPICEVEFELKRGPLAGLLEIAARWVAQQGLWLDVRSKAQRGERLARGVAAGPVVQAQWPTLNRHMSDDAALRSMVGMCLAQVLPNAADVAAGVGTAEHLHQLRVGLRRMRCALRVFGDWSTATDAAWSSALADLFARLGAARDADVLAESVLPELRRAAAPFAELPSGARDDNPADALRSVACNELLLELIVFAHGTAAPRGKRGEAAKSQIVGLARTRIRRMQRQLQRDAAAFTTLDATLRHRARKRLKRLRHSVEFVASLFSSSAVKRCLDRVRPAQEILGRYNDLTVAEQAFRAQLERDPRAWYAVGWLAAQRAQWVPTAAKALSRLAKTSHAWPARR